MLDVRNVVTIVSLVALASFALWTIGFGLTSTQSLQNQVDDLVAQKNSLQTQVASLQDQVASLNTQLAEKQRAIKNLEALVTAYRRETADLIERVCP